MVASATRRFVRQRAEHRCEYCHTRQLDEPFITDQIEHVIAVQHGGTPVEDNLALACSHRNLMTGPNLAGMDPLTGLMEALFHPRRQAWGASTSSATVRLSPARPRADARPSASSPGTPRAASI